MVTVALEEAHASYPPLNMCVYPPSGRFTFVFILELLVTHFPIFSHTKLLLLLLLSVK